MPHLHKKIKNGRAYYYVREIQRINGKPKVVKQVYLGTAEKLLTLAQTGGEQEDCATLHVEEFGALWLASETIKTIGIVETIDGCLPRAKMIAGLSVGEYFLYAVLNRLVEPHSKHKLRRWYKNTAIQSIKPTRIASLTSANYWKAWNSVTERALIRISNALFEKLNQIEPTKSECLIFDTTNYYTFISPANKASELAQFGKSKAGRDDLRQISLAIVVGRSSGLPIFFQIAPGNMHDSKIFARCMHPLLELVVNSKRSPSVFVFDKGIIAAENIAFIDSKEELHFITSYVPTHLPEIASLPLSDFSEEIQRTSSKDCYRAYRTTHKLWGKDRVVIALYNPITARKNAHIFEESLLRVKDFLAMAKTRVDTFDLQWRDTTRVLKRVSDTCARYHVPMSLFAIWFEGGKQNLRMHFNLIDKEVENLRSSFGKSLIVTDLDSWSTKDIVNAYLDRFKVESSFRQSKDPHVVSTQPFFHWTDSKIRCHLLTCFIALCASRILELALNAASLNLTANEALSEMRSLHSVISRSKNAGVRSRLETPSVVQAKILAVFNSKIVHGVLHSSALK